MYIKLALRNIQRSIKDYIIYFVTITLTASLMYSFLSLGLSRDIISLSENMSLLTSGIIGASVLVAFIASFIIGFAVRFMLTQRKKEFAIYELLGMENKSMQKLFFIENSIIGILAFLLGVLSGSVLSGLLVQLVNNIFKAPRSYHFSFSIRAVGVALLMFSVMYSFGIFRAAVIIRKSKIVELLYDSYKNESVKNNRISARIFIIIFSLCAMAGGGLLLARGLLIQTNDVFFFMGGAVLLIMVGIYEMYRNIPFLLLTCLKKCESRKYKGTNLFYFGQIGHKVQSAGKLMAVTAIIFTVSLSTMFIGLVMGAGYEANMEADYPYDAGVALDAPLTKESMNDIIDLVKKKCPVQDYLSYYLYTADGYSIEALSLSDYNHLRRILGLKQVELQANSFMVHCDTWNYVDRIKEALETDPGIILANTQLLISDEAIYTEPMEQYQMAGTKGYVLVVPDAVASRLSGDKTRLVMKLENAGFPELRQEIHDFLHSKEWNPQLQDGKALPEQIAMRVTVKAWGIENSLTGFTSISFCGLYLSIIFIILSCTVLAFEQLSVMDFNSRSYQILDKIGVEKENLQRLILKETGTFFFIPAVLPVAITILLIVASDNLFGDLILQKNLIPTYGMITLLIFGFIYAVYFLAAGSIFKRSVLK